MAGNSPSALYLIEACQSRDGSTTFPYAGQLAHYDTKCHLDLERSRVTRSRESRWDNYRAEEQVHITHADKLAIAAFHEAELGKERSSANILQELSSRYSRSERQLQRYIQEVKESSSINAAQAERSGHWPSLRELARALSTSFYAPLSQILGLPWRHSPEFNGNWTMDQSKRIEGISLSREENPLYDSLMEHLPGHAIWGNLAAWKVSLLELADSLHEMVNQVDYDAAKPGVTLLPNLARASVLEAAEMADGRTVNTFNLESNGDRGYILRRYRNGSSWIDLATGDEELDLEGLKEDFLIIRTTLSASPNMTAVQEQIGNVQAAGRSTVKELERITLMAAYPGRCSFCP